MLKPVSSLTKAADKCSKTGRCCSTLTGVFLKEMIHAGLIKRGGSFYHEGGTYGMSFTAKFWSNSNLIRMTNLFQSEKCVGFNFTLNAFWYKQEVRAQEERDWEAEQDENIKRGKKCWVKFSAKTGDTNKNQFCQTKHTK